jgi:hypothetical protein
MCAICYGKENYAEEKLTDMMSRSLSGNNLSLRFPIPDRKAVLPADSI